MNPIAYVFNSPGPFQRAAVDSDPQGLGELLPVEGARLLREFDRSLEQAQIHVVLDEALTELLQPAPVRTSCPTGTLGVLRGQEQDETRSDP